MGAGTCIHKSQRFIHGSWCPTGMRSHGRPAGTMRSKAPLTRVSFQVDKVGGHLAQQSSRLSIDLLHGSCSGETGQRQSLG